MNENEKEIMEKVHRIQFKLLCEFDDYCKLHNIRYYLAAGTLLGAARHQDFIPWDDDMDVYMTRDNYTKFMNYIAEFQYPFAVDCPTPEDTFFWDFTTRLVYKKSKLKFNEEENLYYDHKNNEYLFLDIFVLDKTFDGFKRFKHIIELKLIYGLMMSRRHSIDYSIYGSILEKMQVFVLSSVGNMFLYKSLFKMYNKISQKYNSCKGAKFGFPSNITVNFLGKLVYQEDWHQNVGKLQIRNRLFMVPKNYVAVLKSVYGNYKELPPKSKQIPEHIDMLEKIEIEIDE